MKTVIIIPARKGSTRFANKPLAMVAGKLLLQRTWQIAMAVKGVDAVMVATDDLAIKEAAEKFGAQTLLTQTDCANGTERVMVAVKQLSFQPDIIINLQGDAVLTPPWVVQAVIAAMKNDQTIQLATPATHLDQQRYDEFVKSKANGRASGTTVVFDINKNALYFSKAVIPFLRTTGGQALPVYRHIGLYGYRYASLMGYSKLKPTPLEAVEQLEQLRFLENGLAIKVIEVDYRGRTHWSIDNVEDLALAEAIIKREGELVP